MGKCSRQFPKHLSSELVALSPGALAGSLSSDSCPVGIGTAQPSSGLPAAHPLWLDLCAELPWSRIKPSGLPFSCLSFPRGPGWGGERSCGLPRATRREGKRERWRLTSKLLHGNQSLRSSTPARPSYRLPGTTCATAGHAWAHPERQVPPHPVGSSLLGRCGPRASREGLCCARSHARTLGYASEFGDCWQEPEILEVPTEAQARLGISISGTGDCGGQVTAKPA